MLTMRDVLGVLLKRLGPAAMLPDRRRETILTEIMPQTLPLAHSRADWIDAVRDAGYGYRTQTMYADMGEAAPGYLGWQFDSPARPSVHDRGQDQYRYDVDQWWQDDEGEYYVAAEHRSYHREGFTIWSDVPLSYDEAIAETQRIVERTAGRDPDYREGYYARMGMPQDYVVAKVHVQEHDTLTYRPFRW